MTPNWDRVWERANEDIVAPAPEFFRGTVTNAIFTADADDIGVQLPEELDPPDWDTPDDGENIHTPPPPLRKSARFTARIAIEIAIELWTWIVDTGAESESDWPGWGKHGDYRIGGGLNPLCDYAFNYLRNRNPTARDVITCNYCPYKKLFGRPCNNMGTHFDLPCTAIDSNYLGKNKEAQAFLDELLQLQRVIILDPKSVLPGSQQ